MDVSRSIELCSSLNNQSIIGECHISFSHLGAFVWGGAISPCHVTAPPAPVAFKWWDICETFIWWLAMWYLIIGWWPERHGDAWCFIGRKWNGRNIINCIFCIFCNLQPCFLFRNLTYSSNSRYTSITYSSFSSFTSFSFSESSFRQSLNSLVIIACAFDFSSPINSATEKERDPGS